MLTLAPERIIWIYWAQGWDNAPLISKLCLQSWYNHNPSNYWIIPLDDDKLLRFLNLSQMMPDTSLNKIDKVAMSDIIRLALLYTYGGIWVDATVLCLKPLHLWLDTIIDRHGFFAYDKHIDKVAISSWLIGASYNNLIIKYWWASIIEYWKRREKKHTYLWLHELFKIVYNNNIIVKQMWDGVPKFTSSIDKNMKLNGPHAFVPYHSCLHSKITDEQINYINNGYNNNFCLKLTRHNMSQQIIFNHQTTVHHILKQEKLI